MKQKNLNTTAFTIKEKEGQRMKREKEMKGRRKMEKGRETERLRGHTQGLSHLLGDAWSGMAMPSTRHDDRGSLI